ncbi:MAG: penicillin-binding protein 2 [Vulcanimicrobiaceae bacterium]
MQIAAERPPRRPGALRLSLVAAAVALALLALLARVGQLQLADGARYAAAARANLVRTIPIPAPRGEIVDRRGRILVRSRPSFVCALVPSQIGDIAATLRRLAAVLRIPQATLRRRMLHRPGVAYRDFAELAADEPYAPVVLARDLSAAQTARLAEAQEDLRGVELQVEPVRDYPYRGLGSHIFGYVGAISEAEYRRLRRFGYTPRDTVGEDGLELTYERYLRGVAGGERIEVDAAGDPVRTLGPLDPIPGDTLELTIDWRLQVLAERALRTQLALVGKRQGARRGGAVVVLDPSSGAVLALVSQPNFNPNDFATGIGEKKFSAYLNDSLEPLFDRAIAAATPTGSTFKLVTGSGAISSGAIGTNQVLYDSGAWECHGFLYRDLAAGALGWTNFVHALAASSDGYFYQVGYRLGQKRLAYWAHEYGLGKTLGIDLPGEYPGNWPTNAWMMKNYGLPLEPSDVCQLAIGQGAMQATPLQMADITATVVNGGTLYRPHLVAQIVAPDGKVVKRFGREVIRRVPVTQESLREVRAGMAQVTEPWGTAYGEAIPGLPFGGKTGTAETSGGSGPNTTWFVAYAPADHPKLALAVFMQRTGGYGADTAAPVARAIFAGYFHKKIPP